MNYSIQFTTEASNDLDESIQYIALVLENPDAATSLLSAIELEVNALKEMPHRCPLVDDEFLSSFAIRFTMVKNYSIFFQINDKKKEIYILRVLFAKQNWIKLLSPKFT